MHTENTQLDRNHLEPHPASPARLKRLIETEELKKVWRIELVGCFEVHGIYSKDIISLNPICFAISKCNILLNLTDSV